MKKVLEIAGALAISAIIVGLVYAAAVTAPTITLSKTSPSGGTEMRDIIITDLNTIATAIGTAAVDGGAGSFTTLAASGQTTLTNVTVTGNVKLTKTTTAGSETATLTNAPAAGDPEVWLTVMVGTNTYVIPAFAAE